MGYKVIIAEKPSLAKNIALAIDKNLKMKNGYYANDEYIITFAYGHLFSLYDIEAYSSDYKADAPKRWTLDGLPFYPQEFKFGLTRDDGIIKQYKLIRDLINRDDVESIVNAGDSDREGEIIIRIILKYALKKDKPIKRLWMPDQTPKTIKSELEMMRDDSEYDSLANEGLARTYVDWLYGINLTRYATLKANGKLLRVGRVIAPIVQAIYERDMAITSFKPKKYYSIVSKEKTNGEEVELVSKTEFPIEQIKEADNFCNEYNKLVAKVTSLTSEKKTISPGKLYSLSKLQGELGKKYKMSLDKSLQIVQNLYEKGYVSYPRTPSQYLAENEKPKFREIISSFQKMGVNIRFKDSKSIFDDSKIESHSALTPTYKIPKKSELSEEEYKVYKAIANRFFAVFSAEDCIVSRTTMEISLGDKETFKLTGDVVLSKGWTVFEEREKKDKVLPNLQVGEVVNIDFKKVEKETKPPKHYTVETLNNFLKNPFKENMKELDELPEEDERKLEEEELRAMFEGVELGTEATRSGIIANAIKSQYISLKDNTYKLEPMGKYYVETLSNLKIIMAKEKTAELGRSLKKVYKGEYRIDDAVEIAKKEISEVFNSNIILENNYAPKVFEVEKSKTLCKCPKCKNVIAITDFGYRCCYTGCGLVLFKNNKLFEKINKEVSKQVAKEIFTKGEITFEDLVSKNNTVYKATLVADFSDKYVKFKFTFPENVDANANASETKKT